MTYSTCCKDCPDRHLACHDTCERYKAVKAKADEIKAKKNEEFMANAYTIERVVKVKDNKAKLFNRRPQNRKA